MNAIKCCVFGTFFKGLGGTGKHTYFVWPYKVENAHDNFEETNYYCDYDVCNENNELDVDDEPCLYANVLQQNIYDGGQLADSNISSYETKNEEEISIQMPCI